ncbi:hypothetical protein TIFTF001_011563 [Ficus carica]|uniref:Uncharacterized protein n=1 Tax=Ficus carica TaxID=3494 RepID=A0AA87ZYH2_FICCA|nr:hypothetical protein TIFTF001_011563 [Ficus carica]
MDVQSGRILRSAAETGEILWSYATGAAVYGGMYWLHGTTQKHARDNWLNHGGDLYNRRYAKKETKISPETASKLRLKWKFYAGKDITATPAIFKGTLYFPSWNGYLYAVSASEGSLVWKVNLQNLTGLKPTGFVVNVNWTVSRATPTVAGDDLLDLLMVRRWLLRSSDRRESLFGQPNLVVTSQALLPCLELMTKGVI